MFRCRFYSKTVGYYRHGGTPTIIDPRSTGHAATDLTDAHEQTHKALFDNTVYGYVLRRLHELSDQGAQAPGDLNRLMTQLGKGLFLCAEGSATAAELLHCQMTRPEIEVIQLMQSLPDQYLAAVAPFIPFSDLSGKATSKDLWFPRLCLIHAVAELCADSAFLAVPVPGDFWDVVQCLLAARAPDLMLSAASNAVRKLTGRYQGKPPTTQQELLKEARAFIGRCKVMLAEKLAVPVRHPPMTDAQRVEVIAALDQKLTAAFPRLERIKWTADVVANTAVAVELQEPAFLLDHVMVPAEQLVDRLRSFAAAPGFYHVVIEFVHEPRLETYRVLAYPFLRTDLSPQRGAPYLICLEASAEVVRSIDQSGLPLTWLPYAYDLGSGGLYDEDFIRSLQAPCFLELQQFSWDTVERIAAAWPGPRVVAFYTLPPGMNLFVSALEMDRATLFGLTPLCVPPDVLVAKPTTSKQLSENPALEMVMLIVLNRSSKESIDNLGSESRAPGAVY
jgi:hypothetical protein